MFKTILIALVLAYSENCCARDIVKVAIVDTGLDLSDPRFSSKLCPVGHEDLTGEGMQDNIGHGTHITGIVKKHAGHAKYCFLMYKYFSYKASGRLNLLRELAAFRIAISNGANIINYSSGGSEFNEDEYLMIKDHPNVTFVVAAGNERQDLDKKGQYFYPASYRLPNVIAVGSLNDRGDKSYGSNYGSFLSWEIGTDVVSTVPCVRTICTGVMSGTSMAAAVKTGKILRTYKKVDN